MSTPDHPEDERSIADTGMFKRFVEYETELDDTGPRSGKAVLIAVIAIVAIVVIAVVIWLLTR